ncbi:MAG: hypothetical protein JNK69_11750 [Saprospiraceae bacterium]|nr:hypothetical protein [Saprospiraceae bacterium]MCC6842162.1 hypothetical protein [Saprospiraceae bacterium]
MEFNLSLPDQQQINNWNTQNHSVIFNLEQTPKLAGIDVAIFGIGSSVSKKFRDEFYQMNLSAFKDLTITDLGDLDSCNPIEISRILFYLLDQNIIPIVFACPKEIIDTIAKYQENRLEPFSLSLISNFINKIDLDSITKSLFLKKVHLIAIQRHYTKKEILFNTQDQISTLYLSEYRKSNSTFEPFARNSEYVFFDLNAVRSSDFPANKMHTASGLFSEEAVGICKMSGSGDKNKCLFISDWHSTNQAQNENLVAQMVWYFIEGIALKKFDHQDQTRHMTEYVVELQDSEAQIQFYKSEISGKWWFRTPGIDSDINPVLTPCTYEEYLMTVQAHAPSRILELFQK